MAEVGQSLPDFKLRAAMGGETIDVEPAKYKGQKWLVISAYPAAFTGGCSNQTSSFNRALQQFKDRNTEVIGFSTDPVPSLRTWAQGMGGIGYPLASDFWPHGKASEALGILNTEGGTARRSVTIVDPQGRVRWFQLYQPGTVPDPKDVLAELEKLQKA